MSFSAAATMRSSEALLRPCWGLRLTESTASFFSAERGFARVDMTATNSLSK